MPNFQNGEYYDPEQKKSKNFIPGVISDNWRILTEEVPDSEYKTRRYRFVTPGGELTMVTRSNNYTTWVAQPLLKKKSDIDLIAKYITTPKCDVESVNKDAQDFGDNGIVRGSICCFDIYGQPGAWQDAACIVGIEKLILATYDDPKWVHELLSVLQHRKKIFMESMDGANYDLVELGGGDGSSTVISPKLFAEFIAPYDQELIKIGHKTGQKIVYHTCGGMMPILEQIAEMNPDAMETFTPPEMGGDVNLMEAKKRIGSKVCMIGGFDQFHFFKDCSPEETRREVRRCFAAAGDNGGYIICPSDHFFDADPELIKAYADEAKKCVY